MVPNTLTFRLVTGCRSTNRRALGFLEGHMELDAETEFEALKSNGQSTMRARFDYWLAEGVCDSYFHGFKNDSNWKYRECFVFRWKTHRWYGFLCHPLPKSNPAFLVCALCIHVYKNEQDTDRAELQRVYEWQTSLAAQAAIAQVFQEKGGDQWTN